VDRAYIILPKPVLLPGIFETGQRNLRNKRGKLHDGSLQREALGSCRREKASQEGCFPPVSGWE